MTSADDRRVRLLSLDEVPAHTVRVYHVAFRAQIIIVLVLAALVVFCSYAWWVGGVTFTRGDGMPAGLGAWIAVWCGLFLLLYANDLRKALSPRAWLVQLADDGVYIKFQSYQNVQRDGPQVVYVPFRDIRSARAMDKTWVTQSLRTSRTNRPHTARQACAELVINAAVSLDDISHALARERSGALDIAGPSGNRGVWRHYPVSVEPGNIVRIEWRARPSVSDFLEYLAVRVRMADRVESTTDTLHAPANDALREMARRGDILELTRAIRACDGGSLYDARKKAEQLIAES